MRMDSFQYNAVRADVAFPSLHTYMELILEEKINKILTPCSLQTHRIYLFYGAYMTTFYFRASALFRFLMKPLLAISCIGWERPVITLTTLLKPLAIGHSYFFVKVLPLDNSGALQSEHIKFLINAPRAINESLRMSHVYSYQCH